MTLDKAIFHGKEHRKPYRGPKAYDRSCRNHGGCSYCEKGRMRKKKIAEVEMREQLREMDFARRPI